MLARLIICSSIICLALGDVKHLPRTYLPPSLPEVVEKPNTLTYLPPIQQEVVQESTEVNYNPLATPDTVSTPNVLEAVAAHDVPDLTNNQVDENDSQSAAVTKEASKDPVYGNFGGLPGAFPNPGFPGPGFQGQFPPFFPPQVYPGQGFPPSVGFINPSIPPQAFPGQGFPGQGFPGQGFPGQVFPGQAFPGQGFPGQGFPGQGFPGQGFPAPGFVNAGFPVQGVPNYPVYFSTSEQLQAEAKEDNVDGKLRTSDKSHTQYDDANGGYLYQKPSVIF